MALFFNTCDMVGGLPYILFLFFCRGGMPGRAVEIWRAGRGLNHTADRLQVDCAAGKIMRWLNLTISC